MKSTSSTLYIQSSNAFIRSSSDISTSKSIWTGVTKAAEWLAGRTIAFLCGETYCEPQVQTKCDRAGSQYFSVFDPYTRETYTFDSETEVRVWLETRYSR